MEQKDFWVIIDNQKIVVTEEVYRAYMRPEWREKKNSERRSRCIVEGGNRCKENCARCSHFRSGTHLSMEGLQENGFDIPAQIYSLEEKVEKQELIKALYKSINALPEKERKAVIMFSRGKTGKEIGEELGISQQAASKMLRRIWPKLAEELKAWK